MSDGQLPACRWKRKRYRLPAAGVGGGTVTSTLQTRTAWAVTFVTVVLLTLSRALLPGQQWQLTVEFITAALGNALLILACAGVGLLIISRQPGNVIGWSTPWSPSSLPPASSPVATPPDHCLPKFGCHWPPTWRGSRPFLWARRCCCCCSQTVGCPRRAGARSPDDRCGRRVGAGRGGLLSRPTRCGFLGQGRRGHRPADQPARGGDPGPALRTLPPTR